MLQNAEVLHQFAGAVHLGVSILPGMRQKVQQMAKDLVQDVHSILAHVDAFFHGAHDVARGAEHLAEVIAGDQGHQEIGSSCRTDRGSLEQG